MAEVGGKLGVRGVAATCFALAKQDGVLERSGNQ